jgi:hypothetical protein
MKTAIRQQAEVMFLENRGTLSLSEIARRLKISKPAILKWAKVDRWKEKLADLDQAFSEKVSERINQAADDLADRAATIARKSWQPLEDALRQVERFLDPETPGQNLTPQQLRQLVSAQSEIIKSARLLAGESTEHQRQTIEGRLHHEHEVPGYLDEIIQRVIRSGDVEGQLMLMKIQENLQALLDFSSGEGDAFGFSSWAAQGDTAMRLNSSER